MQRALLAPAAVLVAWSLVMLVWAGATRLPALAAIGGIARAKPGGRGQDLENVLPPKVNWKAHNYTHLMEQPTLFYALVAILAIVGPTRADVWLAWAYVALRVVHSFYQATVNRVPVRFAIFVAATACLMGLTAHAVLATLAQS